MMNEKERRIPQHVAIIMDGNGRWAKQRNLSRTSGHVEGVRRVKEILSAANRVGIKVLTLFTFSTENWSRPEGEVTILMRTVSDVLQQNISVLNRKNIKFQFLGRENGVPEKVWSSISKTMEATKENTGMVLNMAFNYGSRVEILDAVKSIAQRVKNGELGIGDISEKVMSDSLYTKDLPDPDLLIRTSGEQRISNFLLWQLSYAELYFTEKFWPEFNEAELDKAIESFQERDRRFGSVSAQKTN